MNIRFSKFQGTGNDFIMIDNLNGEYSNLTVDQVRFLCDRKFGIGADGLILISSKSGYAFEMDYFNSDGSKSFCGNGARCSVAFAATLGIDVSRVHFYAIDGAHYAEMKNDLISLEMIDVASIEVIGEDLLLYTGSPHFIRLTKDLYNEDIVETGKEIRYSERFKKEGVNVNLMEIVNKNEISVQTYERGVEDETLSCGTGVTACGLVYGTLNDLIGEHSVSVKTKGGELKVSFDRNEAGSFSNIKLIGPAKFVYKGEVNV